ncbi:hypothetical protein BJ508DRAFT_85087 [Ascobolus immersus RN42]|uniref:Nucleoside phosphorylase domain-containing protein n=1 Tax=Ascobolus immersus RN42 TaxID=1160509 RepID=A0A3N4HDV7_ASCIM|nr:hypothetical protein BJ508DRAFT_85087 [Ascobolus immersus RN42]
MMMACISKTHQGTVSMRKLFKGLSFGPILAPVDSMLILRSRLKQASHERNSLRSISRSHAVIRKRESLPAVAHWQEQQSEHRPHPTTTQSFPVAHKLSEFTGLSEAHSRHTLVDHYSEAASQSLPQLPQGTDRSSPQYSPPILDRHPRMSAIHASSAHVTRPNSTPNLRAAMDSNLAFVKESQNTRSSTLLADPTPAFRIAGYEASGAVSNSHIAELSIPDPADFIYEAQGDAGFDMYGPSRNFANLTIVDEPGDYENGPVKERQTLEHDTSPFQDGRQTLEMGYVQQENPIVELDASEPYRGAPKTPEPDFSNPVSWEAPYPSPYPNQSYKVAWYCEQPYNHGAALLMLDRIHGRPQTCHPWDVYNYVLGEACGHNIIVVYRKQDTDVAAGKPDGLVIESRAGWVGRIFPNICVSFELGVAGALAGPAVDESSIRLGDVVLGSLRDSVMTYWVPTLNEEKKTLRILRVHDGYNFTEELLQDIQSKPGAKRNLRENVILPQLHRLVEQVCPGNPEMLESCRKIWDTPGPENDVLQLSGYQHRSNSAMIPSTIETVAPTPNTFDWTRFEFPQQDQVIVRNPRKMLFVNNNPAIHFGTILAPIYNHNPTVRNWEVQVLKEVNWEFVRQATLAKCADIFDTRHLNLSELQGKRVYENCIAIRGISGYCSMPRLGTDDGGEYDGTVTMEDRWRNYASAAAAAMARYMLKDHISPINIEKYAIKVAPAEPTSFRRKMLAKGQAKQAKMMEKLNLSSRGNC